MGFTQMRCCILQTHSRVNDDLFRLTLQNHAEYCDRHGYDMLQYHRTYEESMRWGAEDYVLDAIERYDAVLAVGSDVIFTNPAVPLSFFDDGERSVFLGEEGLNSSLCNFDVVLWTRADGVRQFVRLLRETRPRYASHPWGLQQGVNLLAGDPDAAKLLRLHPPRVMQSAPFPNVPGMWRPGDFALHFVGMSNADKFAGCRQFLETGTVRWLGKVGQNDALRT